MKNFFKGLWVGLGVALGTAVALFVVLRRRQKNFDDAVRQTLEERINMGIRRTEEDFDARVGEIRKELEQSDAASVVDEFRRMFGG